MLVNYLTDHDIQDYLVNQPGGSIIVSSRKSGQNEYQTTIRVKFPTVATGQAYRTGDNDANMNEHTKIENQLQYYLEQFTYLHQLVLEDSRHIVDLKI